MCICEVSQTPSMGLHEAFPHICRKKDQNVHMCSKSPFCIGGFLYRGLTKPLRVPLWGLYIAPYKPVGKDGNVHMCEGMCVQGPYGLCKATHGFAMYLCIGAL